MSRHTAAPPRGNSRDDTLLGVLREEDGLSSAPGSEISFEPLRAMGTDDLMTPSSAFDGFDFNLDDSESMMSHRNSAQPLAVGHFAARMFNGSGGSGSSMLMDDADAALEMSLNSMSSLCLDGSLRASNASGAMLTSSSRSNPADNNGAAIPGAIGSDDSNNEGPQRPQPRPQHPQRGGADDDAIAEARAVLAGQLHDNNNINGKNDNNSYRNIYNNNIGRPSEERRRPTSRRSAQQQRNDGRGHRLVNSGTRIINNVNLDPEVPSGGERRARSMNLGGTTLRGLASIPAMNENDVNLGTDLGDLARFLQQQQQQLQHQQQQQQKAGALLEHMASRRQSDPGTSTQLTGMVPNLRDISDPKEYSAALSKLAESMKRTEASRQQLMWQRKVLAAQNEEQQRLQQQQQGGQQIQLPQHIQNLLRNSGGTSTPHEVSPTPSAPTVRGLNNSAPASTGLPSLSSTGNLSQQALISQVLAMQQQQRHSPHQRLVNSASMGNLGQTMTPEQQELIQRSLLAGLSGGNGRTPDRAGSAAIIAETLGGLGTDAVVNGVVGKTGGGTVEVKNRHDGMSISAHGRLAAQPTRSNGSSPAPAEGGGMGWRYPPPPGGGGLG
mmetsp:Transcript_14131/g.32494  ORF Transcript_14131/g.32494 Transcript_14131/m.32494 type:complete len:610 (+) Transcript_14131:649-2478(+)